MEIEDPWGPDNRNGSDQRPAFKSPLLREDDVNNPDHQETWTEFLLAEPVAMKTALHLSDDQRIKMRD